MAKLWMPERIDEILQWCYEHDFIVRFQRGVMSQVRFKGMFVAGSGADLRTAVLDTIRRCDALEQMLDRGAQAREAGLALEQCPHPLDSNEWNMWVRGWELRDMN